MKSGCCRVTGCEKGAHGHGYCVTHYRYWTRTGKHPGVTPHDGKVLVRHLVMSMLRVLGHDQGDVASLTITPAGLAVVVLTNGEMHLHPWDAP